MNVSVLSSIIFLFITSLSHSQQLIILDKEEKKYIGKYTSVLEDPTSILTINDILKSKNLFKPIRNDVFTTVSTNSAFWIKLKVKKISNNEYFFIIDNPFISQIDIYSEENNKIIHHIQSGNNLPFSKKEIKRNNFIFDLNLIKDNPTTLYVRYSSIWRMDIPMSFETSYKVIEGSTLQDLWYGIFYGIIFVAFVYNLFIFLITKYSGYFFYLGILLSFALFRSLAEGISFQYIFPDHPKFNIILIYLSYPIIGICVNYFSMGFLSTKVNTPRLHKGFHIINAIFIFLFFLPFINSYAWNILSNFMLLVFPNYIMVVGILVYRKGYTPAKYYNIGTIFYFLTVILAFFRNFGQVPYSFLVYNFGDFGLALIAIFYTLALGERYNLIEKEKKQVQIAYNKELESTIEEKNHLQIELNQLNKNLRNTNADLDSFIYSASHDLKVPIINIEGLLNILKYEQSHKNGFLEIIGMIKTSVSKFENTVNDLNHVTQIQRTHQLDIEQIDIAILIEHVITTSKNYIQESNATIEVVLEQCKTVTFSRNNLTTIFEQLIDNAIKYRSSERDLKIKISSKEDKIYCIFLVSDNGMGINKENQSKIFTMFKRAHAHVAGKGLGLYIIKRIIENSGGKIEVESEENKGTTFRVYLRK